MGNVADPHQGIGIPKNQADHLPEEEKEMVAEGEAVILRAGDQEVEELEVGIKEAGESLVRALKNLFQEY